VLRAFVERGVLYFFLHTEHGMLAWTDRAANTSIQEYDRMGLESRSRQRIAMRSSALTAVALSALFGAEHFDISSSAWK
jgi:hypothetical protein